MRRAFLMVQTLRTTLGVQGHRPVGGHLDGHDVLDVVGALNVVTGPLTTRTVERPRLSTRVQQRYWQEAFARHVRDIARAYPAAQYPRVMLVIDKAAWHRGALVTAVLRAFPHLALYPLPSSSPKLQVIERVWKVLRRRATPNRLFPTMAQLKRTVRNNLCYYQTLKHRVLTVIQSARKRKRSSAA